jgi:hypothetical protein
MSPEAADDRTADEILAEKLVEEALDGMALPPRLRKIVRVSMIGELLATPEGRAQLRRASADPTVASSGEVDKTGAPPKQEAAGVSAKAHGGPGRRGGGRP